jgi:hypothetical protein
MQTLNGRALKITVVLDPAEVNYQNYQTAGGFHD